MKEKITSSFPMKHTCWIYLAVGVIAFILSACDSSTPPPVSLTNLEGTVVVDDVFQEYYQQLGGESVLGPAISTVQTQDGVLTQYTHAALMVYNPDVPAVQRFHLAPLGQELGVLEPPAPASDPERGAYVDGHYIFPEFQTLFDRLGGVRVVGKPLSEVHFNLQKNRYEQYFENLGFYRMEGQTADGVALLSYGAYRCDHVCRSKPPQNAIIEAHPEVKSPFLEAVNRLGVDLTGFSLSDAYFTDDGRVEQIFENVILVVAFDDPNQVHIRPLYDRMGILADAPRLPSSDPSTYFYEVENGYGYNVPAEFWNFISTHGGFEVAGSPVAEMDHSRGLFHQCYTNLCLEYTQQKIVRPVSLGYQYRGFYYRPLQTTAAQGQDELQSAATQPPASEVVAATEPVVVIPPELEPTSPPQPEPAQPTAVQPAPTAASAAEIILQVWTKSASIAADIPQEVGVRIYGNGLPLADAVPVVFVSLPDGTQWTGSFPPSDQNGQTQIQIPPVNAQNGTLIPYQVCLDSQNGEKSCYQDSYMVWGNP